MEENYLPSKKKHWFKNLMLLEVGIIEVLIVGVVTFIFFAVFNYFNILRLSDLYPKYLGWLPRQENKKENTIKYDAPKSISPSNNFSLEKEKTFILISENLKTNFLPPKEDKLINILSTQFNNTSTLKWEKEKASISAGVIFSPNRIPLSSSINIIVPYNLNSPISSSESANTIIGTFFKLPNDIVFRCEEEATNKIKECSTFWQVNQDLKRGITISPNIQSQDKQYMHIISMCMYFRESGSLFESDKCLMR